MCRFLLVYGIVFLLSCESGSNSIHHIEFNEVYNVIEGAEGYDPNKLMYQDSIVYQSEFLPLVKYAFERDKSHKGKEIYPITGSDNKTIKSIYYDANGNELSYYNYTLNDDLQKTRIEAYEATTGELLRFEEIDYNLDKTLKTRKIFASNGLLQTSYNFIYDEYGNETSKITQHLQTEQTVIEKSTITKFSSDKKWLEKWGFIDEYPVAFYRRRITKE